MLEPGCRTRSSILVAMAALAGGACTPDVGADPTPTAMEVDLTAAPPRAPQPTALIVNPQTGLIDFSLAGTPIPDLGWFAPDGNEMDAEDWWHNFGHSITLFVNGEGIRELGPHGERRTDSSFLLLWNAYWEPLEFVLPGPEFGQKWSAVLDTAEPRDGTVVEANNKLLVRERSLVVLDRVV